MKNFKLLTLLAVLCTAAFVTSCEDEENWQPTWAIPVVKETTLMVADFVDSSMTKPFCDTIRGYWDDYVNQKLGDFTDEQDSIMKAHNIDSMALAVITDTSLNYITRPTNSDSAPQLTEDAIKENNLTDEQVDQINDFLNNNKDLIHLLPGYGGGAKSLSLTKGKGLVKNASPTSTGGKGVIDNLLSGIEQNPLNIFPTVATLVGVMPGYMEQINAELDNILDAADMNDLIDLNLKQIAKDAEGVKRIEVHMEVDNTLPFQIDLGVSFVDANADPIHNLINEKLTTKSSVDATVDDATKLADIVNRTSKVQLKVNLSKQGGKLTEEQLRDLAKKGIKFSLRVKVKANMSKFIDL